MRGGDPKTQRGSVEVNVMKKPRHQYVNNNPDREKGPNGKLLCKVCRNEVPKGRRRTICSEECSEQLHIMGNPSYVRYKLLERDKGICAECGIDCDRVDSLRWYVERIRPRFVSLAYRMFKSFMLRHGLLNKWRQENPTVNVPFPYESCWQADHIVPVAEGGGLCGLDNYRTLCKGCHDKETARLMQRLAAKRKGQKLMYEKVKA